LARISTYVIDGTIVDDDKVIGSDANNSMITKNYTVRDLAAYIGYSIGNNLLVPYVNASQNVDLGAFNLTANSIIVGNQLILGGTAGLVGQVLMSNGSGSPASWAYNIGSQTLRDVLIQGNIGNKNLILSNTTGSLIGLDLDKVYNTSVGIRLFDSVLNNTANLLSNKLDVQDSSLQKTASYFASGIRYSSNGFDVFINANSYANQTLLYPSNGGVLVTSVNGTTADLTGNVTLGGLGVGTVTSVAVTNGTGISASVANPTTTPNITITNTAPDQIVSLASGIGISVTGTYPSFTIATTGSGSTPTLQEVTDVGNIVTDLGNTAFSQLLFDQYNIQEIGGSGVGINVNSGNPYLYVQNSGGGTTYYSHSQIILGPNSLLFPALTTNRYLTLSVNGNYADLTGAITIPVGTGTVTSIATSGLISGGTITTSGTISTSINTNKLVGRSTIGVGEMEEITIGTGLSLSAGTLNATAAGILHGTASGTDTYTVTIAGATAYADGDAYLIGFPNGNTTTATINISGLGTVGLYRNNDGPIIGGDIWNGAEMLCVYNSTTGGFQLIGTSPNAMYAYVTNADSVTITKGQVVYAFGGQGDRMTVKLANNTGDATSAQTVGVVLSTSIAANQKGVIITQGLLNGLSILPTATYADGDPLYLGATAGSVTNVKPYAPNHLVYLGNVTTSSNGAAGRWYVRVQNGYELDELHNVQARTPSLKDTLWYDNAVSPAQWKTASIPTILGYTPIGGTGTINEIAYFTSTGSTIGSLTTATYPSLTELSYVKGVTSSIQTQIGTKQATITGAATTITSSDLTASRALISNASGKVAVSAVTDTELGYVSGVTSGIQTQIDGKATIATINNNNILGYQALGSTIKGGTLDLSLNRVTTGISLPVAVSGRLFLIPVYIPVATTITGVKFMSSIAGVYTAANYNGFGLYSYNTVTGAGALLASTPDDGTIFKSSANVLVSKAFSSAASVSAGFYYIGMVWSFSGTPTTTPAILGNASMSTSMSLYDFTNSGKLFCHIISQTTLPSSWTHATNTTNNPVIYWVSLY